MPSARDPSPIDLRQHHGVETPEHVEVRLELAGVGSRMAAAVLDSIIIYLAVMVILWVGRAVWGGGFGSAGSWFLAFLILLMYGVVWGYFAAFEAWNGGRTLGKQALGIRVVMDTGQRVTTGAAVVRNLVRMLDCYFPLLPIVPAMLLMFLNKSNKRLGDMAAGTIVVRDRPTDWALGAVPAPVDQEEPVETGPPELGDDEFRLLDRFLGRLNDLEPAVQVRITMELAKRFEDRIPRRTHDAQAYLVQVFAEEQQKRRGRFATRARTGAGAGTAGRTTVTAERFLAKKREGAADLARAHTYGLDQRVIEYLERVVSAGHNALYRARGKHVSQLGRYVMRDFPAAVVQSWGYVLLAFTIFIVPAAVGYVLIRERPALAEEIVSPVMVGRAEQAAVRQAEGQTYAQADEEERPVIAAAIMSNNIQISFFAFLGGLTGGLVTIALLFTNGMTLGLVFGLFKNYHALSYLTTFVAPLCVLELTAIFISAAARVPLPPP